MVTVVVQASTPLSLIWVFSLTGTLAQLDMGVQPDNPSGHSERSRRVESEPRSKLLHY